MKYLTNIVIAAFFVLGGTEIALACSACIKSIMSAAQYDEQSWQSSEHVFLGLVTSAELVLRAGAGPEIVYKVEPEEVFKGSPASITKVYSTRIINGWNVALEEVGCGSITIGAGDRVLLFSRPDSTAFIGTCSASRVIEGVDADAGVDATLGRLRQWQSDKSV